MEKIYKKELKDGLRDDWEYCDDVKIEKKHYAVAFKHKVTGRVKVCKVQPNDLGWHDWVYLVNEQLRKFAFRKWNQALNKL